MAAGSVPIPSGTYGPGTQTVGPRTVSGTLSKASASLNMTNHTNPAVVLTIMIQISVDGGTTWRDMGGCERRGGPLGTYPDGSPATNLVIQITYPPQSGRQIRASITITGGSIQTSGTFSWQ